VAVRRLVAFAAVVLLALLAAALLLPHSAGGLRELILSAGPAAPALAFAAWVLLVPALFPATLLAAAGGLAFGAVGGGALALVGASVGGIVAFLIGRGLVRAPVQEFVRRRPRLQRVHGLLERRGFPAVLAARLMPGVPTGWLHYAAGASPVKTVEFVGAIALGALLRTVPYAVLGQSLASGSATMIAVAAASIVLGGLAAGFLVRQMRLAPQ
jgi:uncharacterized membrane protein YdjX (TVP38/TMEM64 family)